MSLINKMLVDLEARTQGAATGGKTVFQDLRPAMGASRTQTKTPLWIALAGAGVIATGAAWYLGQQTGQRANVPRDVVVGAKSPTVASAKPSKVPTANSHQQGAAPSVTSAATVEAATSAQPVTPTAPAPAAATAATAAATATATGAELSKPATEQPAVARVETPTLAAATPTPAPQPAAEVKSAGPATAAQPAAERKPAAAVTPAPEATAARMEKTPRALTPEQQAEQAFRAATAAFNRQAFTEAEGGFTKALALQPTHTGAREGLAALLMHTGRSDEAQGLLRAGRALLPRHYAFVQLLARAHIARGEDQAALDLLQQARGIAGHDPEYWAFVATAHQRLQQHHEAVQNYRAAVRLQPSAARAWIGMGISLEALKDTASAQTAYRTALDGQGLDVTLIRFAEQRLAALRR